MTMVESPRSAEERLGSVAQVRRWAEDARRRTVVCWNNPTDKIAQVHRAYREDIGGAIDALKRLGVASPPTRGVRESAFKLYKVRHSTSLRKRLAGAYWIVLQLVIGYRFGALVPAVPDYVADLQQSAESTLAELSILWEPVAFLMWGFVALLGLGAVALLVLVDLSVLSFVFLRDARRWQPVVAIVRVVGACGAVQGKSGPARAEALRNVALGMKTVVKELERVPRLSCLGRRADRRRTARQHVDRVVRRLGAAHDAVHRDGDPALAPLAALLASVAERYAEGRVLGLLEEDQLRGFPAPRKEAEWIRLAALAFVVAAGALGAGLLAMSDPVTMVLILSAGVLGVAILYRKNPARGFAFLDKFRGW
ncbi:hypothetical protein ACIQKB_36725 [Streptomyces sp. NPDC092046]|uniref:hypothetical protein n=1 Tax=Streptomyces sp. NPDC092046 TaxID=3366009 RepID=UPI0038205B53